MATPTKITITATSGGYAGGNTAQISVNEQEIGFGSYGRGLNVAVFDEATGLPQFATHFDIPLGSSEIFADFIKSLPSGRIVAIAVKGDAGSLTDNAKQALKSLGSAQIDPLQAYQSYSLIGIKGENPGTAHESISWLETSSSYSFEVETVPPGATATFVIEALCKPSTLGADYIPQGGEAQIRLNGNTLTPQGGYQSGWNVMVLDSNNGQLKRSGCFHPWNQAAVEQLVQMLQNVTTGEIVAIATQNYAGVQVDESVKKACSSIGSRMMSQLAYGGSWAMVGYRGAKPGEAVEGLSPYSPPEYGAEGVKVNYWGGVTVFRKGDLGREQKLGVDDASAYFAYYDAVSIEGDYALVGDVGNDRVYVYRQQKEKGQWQLEQLLRPQGAQGGNFGISVEVSGNWAMVGQGSASAVHVYELTGSQWQHRQVLQPADLKADDGFGVSVAIAGKLAVVGAYCADTPRQKNCGAAYIFQWEGDKWVQTAKLQPRELRAEDSFGYRVAMDGTVAMVGAYYAGVKGKTHCGAVYVFQLALDNGHWQPQKLQPDDLGANDYFGYAVAVAGNWAIVGASHADAAGKGDVGAAYLYRLQEGRWQLHQKIQATEQREGDYFGSAVGIGGEVAVVGAYGADVNGKADCGAVYLFRLAEGQWELQQKLQPADLPALGLWGYNTSFDGRRAIVGSYGGYLNPKMGFAYVCDVEESEGLALNKH